MHDSTVLAEALPLHPKPGWWVRPMVLAVAMTPSSVFLAGGLVAAFCGARIRWSQHNTAGFCSLLIFASLQLYFPIRYVAQPAYNLASHYSFPARENLGL